MTAAVSSRRRDREVIRRARGYVASVLLRTGDCRRQWPLPLELGRAAIATEVFFGDLDPPVTLAKQLLREADLTGAWPHVEYDSSGEGRFQRDDLLADLLGDDEPPPEELDLFRLLARRSS